MVESNTKKPNWSIREFNEGDEERIRELRGISLSSSKDSQWWKWCYLDGPDGPAIIWLAVAGNKIVSQYPVLPLHMKIRGQTCLGARGFDGMTHPDYRRQGIYTVLGNKVIESGVKNGISIFFATPNDENYPLHIKKLHWFYICEPPLLLRIVDWGAVLKKHSKIPVFMGNLLGAGVELVLNLTSRLGNTDIKIRPVAAFDERVDDFWRKASNVRQIMIVRDRKYLNWRYAQKPGNEYTILLAEKEKAMLGYGVVKLEREDLPRGFIMDVLTLPNDDNIAKLLIDKAIGYLREQGAAIISCIMLQGNPYYGILRKMGFTKRRSGLRLCARLFNGDLSREFIANPVNWYYVWGDSDTK